MSRPSGGSGRCLRKSSTSSAAWTASPRSGERVERLTCPEAASSALRYLEVLLRLVRHCDVARPTYRHISDSKLKAVAASFE
jgi:hypothetical protein